MEKVPGKVFSQGEGRQGGSVSWRRARAGLGERVALIAVLRWELGEKRRAVRR